MGKTFVFRRADVDDVPAILAFGNAIPEIKVSAEADFLSREEAIAAVTHPRGIFLLAESHGALVGFAYANTQDLDRPPVPSHACLVYLAVRADQRGAGLGRELYRRIMDELTSRGVTYVYAWAHPTSGVVEFLQRDGWSKGPAYVWMDKKI